MIEFILTERNAKEHKNQVQWVIDEHSLKTQQKPDGLHVWCAENHKFFKYLDLVLDRV